MNNIIKIATRKSNLALWQANWVADKLKALHPDFNIELVKITTKGDKILDKSLAKIGGKGLFVKELEAAMLSGQADIAVHSLKDMPSEQPNGLELSVYCEREDFRDVLISEKYFELSSMPFGARIGTSSLRRAAQLKIYRRDFEIVPLRGNVDTRIEKAFDPKFKLDGIILASAGVTRLQKQDVISQYLSVHRFLPAPGQGIVTIESRKDDARIKQLIEPLKCQHSAACAYAERAFNRVMGGSCQVPIAAHAELESEQRLILSGQIASPDGKQQISASLEDQSRLASDIGERLAEKILASGGRKIVDNLNL